MAPLDMNKWLQPVVAAVAVVIAAVKMAVAVLTAVVVTAAK